MSNNIVSILGVKIHAEDIELATLRVIDRAKSCSSGYFILANVHLLMEAVNDSAFMAIMNGASGCYPDGMPVAWVIKLLGHKLKKRVRGTDFMLSVCHEAAKLSMKILLFGSDESTLIKVSHNLKKAVPSINIVDVISPPFRELTEQENQQLISTLNLRKPDIIFVALGAPKQEKWMAEHFACINAVIIGVGAAFDYLAGRLKTPPKLLQILCLEWFFRLFQQPAKTIRRMLLAPRFILLVLIQIIKERIINLF